MFPPVYAMLRASPTVLAAVGGDPNPRIYSHGEAPAAPVAPYVVWSVVGDEAQHTLDHVATADRVMYQVDVYHATGLGVQQLSAAVRAALEANGYFTGIVADERERTEPRHFRVGLQFDYWFGPEAPAG